MNQLWQTNICSIIPLACITHNLSSILLIADALQWFSVYLLDVLWYVWFCFTGVHEYQDQVWREPQMFPSEEVLQERSEVHFCCVAPRDAQVINIIFNNTQYPLINISSQVKAIAVDNLNITSDLGVIFQCLDSNEDENITANFVSC